MEKAKKPNKNLRLNTIKQIKLFYSKIIYRYYENTDENLTDNRFKNLCYGLNGLAKVIETSEIETRIEALENNMLLDPNNPNKEVSNG